MEKALCTNQRVPEVIQHGTKICSWVWDEGWERKREEQDYTGQQVDKFRLLWCCGITHPIELSQYGFPQELAEERHIQKVDTSPKRSCYRSKRSKIGKERNHAEWNKRRSVSEELFQNKHGNFQLASTLLSRVTIGELQPHGPYFFSLL